MGDAKPEPLSGVLRALIERLPIRERLREYAIWPQWSELVGPTIAQHARPVRIRRGRLCVAVDSAVWMQELQFLKESLRAKINARIGRDAVDDVFFVLDGNGRRR
jgi:predicted nucleic acid-binding Zn ribbon protein